MASTFSGPPCSEEWWEDEIFRLKVTLSEILRSQSAPRCSVNGRNGEAYVTSLQKRHMFLEIAVRNFKVANDKSLKKLYCHLTKAISDMLNLPPAPWSNSYNGWLSGPDSLYFLPTSAVDKKERKRNATMLCRERKKKHGEWLENCVQSLENELHSLETTLHGEMAPRRSPPLYLSTPVLDKRKWPLEQEIYRLRIALSVILRIQSAHECIVSKSTDYILAGIDSSTVQQKKSDVFSEIVLRHLKITISEIPFVTVDRGGFKKTYISELKKRQQILENSLRKLEIILFDLPNFSILPISSCPKNCTSKYAVLALEKRQKMVEIIERNFTRAFSEATLAVNSNDCDDIDDGSPAVFHGQISQQLLKSASVAPMVDGFQRDDCLVSSSGTPDRGKENATPNGSVHYSNLKNVADVAISLWPSSQEEKKAFIGSSLVKGPKVVPLKGTDGVHCDDRDDGDVMNDMKSPADSLAVLYVTEQNDDPLKSPDAVCETSLDPLKSSDAVCETSLDPLTSQDAVCEMSVDTLKSSDTVCEMSVDTLKSPDGVHGLENDEEKKEDAILDRGFLDFLHDQPVSSFTPEDCSIICYESPLPFRSPIVWDDDGDNVFFDSQSSLLLASIGTFSVNSKSSLSSTPDRNWFESLSPVGPHGAIAPSVDLPIHVTPSKSIKQCLEKIEKNVV